MRTPVPDYLSDLLDACRADERASADGIPQPSADAGPLAVALSTPDGVAYAAGDDDVDFLMESVCKPFVYALALQELGVQKVTEHVDTEPSGDAYNEISLERESGRPRNPMINIGAITTYSLLGDSAQVRKGISSFAGRDLEVDQAAVDSDEQTTDRNRAMAFLARSHGTLLGDPLEVVRGYTEMCSLRVTTADLAMMGATLANDGVNPVTGTAVVGPGVVRQVLSVMTTCGMYDAAGDWMSTVGIPAKSGVSGCILGALPGRGGIGVFSRRLDEYGNSVRGVRVCQRLSAEMGLHLMSAAPVGRVTVRDVSRREIEGEQVTVLALQGVIHFTEGEQVLRRLGELEDGSSGVVLDLHRVSALNAVARRMLLDGVHRLARDGRAVTLVDPDRVLPDPDAGGGARPRVLDALP